MATMTDEQSKERLMALVELIGRTGAQAFQLRYSDDEQPVVWIAVAGYKRDPRNMVYEVGASTSPDRAAFRLAEALVDGGQCTHCKRPTGVDDSWDSMPLDQLVCWYQYDPELKTFRRGCEGGTS